LFFHPIIAVSPDYARLRLRQQSRKWKVPIEQAQALRRQATELSFFASNALGEVDGSTAASLEQRRVEYQAFF
jgi:hypothetical protein